MMISDTTNKVFTPGGYSTVEMDRYMREHISEEIREISGWLRPKGVLLMHSSLRLIIPEAALTDFETLIAWIRTVVRLQT